MMTSDWIFGWWNLVFLAPFLLALIYLGVYAASGVTFGDVDADADFDADANVDVDADADGDLHADLHVEHGVHTGGDAHAAHANGHAHHPPYLAALTWLGVGRVPLSIVLMVLLLTWGAIGFAVNVLVRDRIAAAAAAAEPARAIVFSLPAALAGSLLLTGAISSAITRFIPLNETSARRRHALLGSVGEAVFAIDATSGVVCVRHEGGDLFQVACRTEPGAPPIAKGERVKLTAYDARQKLFLAVPFNPASAAEPATPAGT